MTRGGSILTRLRTAAAAAAAAVFVVAIALEPSSAAPSTVQRLAGGDRYTTAVAISQSKFGPGVAVAYVATGTNYPDALAGAPAAAKTGGPILLVEPNAIPSSTADELDRLDPAKIVVLGGPGAVSNEVAAQLQTYTTGSVVRIAGSDRYATAAAISGSAFGPGVPVAFIATGLTFPDALAGGAAGGAVGGPVILVPPDSIPGPVADELRRLTAQSIVILGGQNAVTPAVQSALEEYTDGTVGRLAGSDRYSTAVGVSRFAYPAGATTVFVATGNNFPDALAGGPVAGLTPGPVLLVPGSCMPEAVSGEIDRLGASTMVIVGGTGVVGVPVEHRQPCTSPATTQPPPTTQPASNCSAAYPDFCIPPPPPDLNCSDLSPSKYPGAHANFTVLAPDPHHFDSNNDGRGCEGGVG